MGFQILQYEFLGPVPIDQWGPPMEKTIYLILSREKDTFNIIYAGDCAETKDESFFVQNVKYKCWTDNSGLEKLLHLAILPLFDSSDKRRQGILRKVITLYRPKCNTEDDNISPGTTASKQPPPPAVKSSKDDTPDQRFPCPCCGIQMKLDKVMKKSTLYKCPSCGLSDTRLNS